MLVLTRHIDQQIVIGDNVYIKILGIQGNHIRVGIQAPKDVSVHREEVFDRIKKEKKSQDMDLSHVDPFCSEKFAEA